MNYYGFKIESSQLPKYTEYLVIASDKETAIKLIFDKVDALVEDADYGWTWGEEPTVSEIENVKKLTNANLIWE